MATPTSFGRNCCHLEQPVIIIPEELINILMFPGPVLNGKSQQHQTIKCYGIVSILRLYLGLGTFLVSPNTPVISGCPKKDDRSIKVKGGRNEQGKGEAHTPNSYYTTTTILLQQQYYYSITNIPEVEAIANSCCEEVMSILERLLVTASLPPACR